MKKIIIIILTIIIVITLGISIIFLINKKDNLETAYQEMYEASTLLSNITYDIDVAWDYYLTDENFNRTELVKRISLKDTDMINDTCNLLYTKKINIILDCITLSHQKSYDKAKKLIDSSKKTIEKNNNSSYYKDLSNYNNKLSSYLEVSKYHGEEYQEYKDKINNIKKDIDNIEDKYQNIYTVKSNNSM